MRNRTYGGVRGRKTKVGRKLLRFPPTRLVTKVSLLHFMPKLHLPPLACRGTFCSFSARTYLYRIFKLKEGCTPAEWREKMAENVAFTFYL